MLAHVGPILPLGTEFSCFAVGFMIHDSNAHLLLVLHTCCCCHALFSALHTQIVTRVIEFTALGLRVTISPEKQNAFLEKGNYKT
jgi:hypothetical protein